jgi:N-methylhydantoinase B
MINPVTLAVIRGRLEQIVDEMDAALFRSAFSPVIAEARDGSHGIYHAETGDTLVQGKAGLPIFVGAMSFAARAAIARANAEGGASEGDVYFMNDPYDGATHLNDYKLVKPFFRGGKVFCQLASVGHWQDVGGNVPGNYNPQATDSMQEGVRIPPVKLFDRGEIRRDMVEIALANSRLPVSANGDLQAQIGALELGEKRLHDLLDEYGDDLITEAMSEMLSRAETLMRAEIAALKDGVYDGLDFLDNDGIVDTPLPIGLDVTVEGDQLTLDFSRSADACAGPLNISRATATAACFVGLKHIFHELPANAGVMKPVTIIIPDGSILAAEAPRPVSGYTETILRMIDVMFSVFARIAPDRVNGAPYGTINALLISGKRDTGIPWILFTFFGGGHGGHPDGDGLSHGNAPISMATIPPVEVLESSFPVIFKQWALRPDSGGAGRHRGGLGAVYEIEPLDDEADLVVLGERGNYHPPGVLEGLPAEKNNVTYQQDDGTHRPSMGAKLFGAKLKPGQSIRIESPGGGGYGAPEDRALDAIAEDLRLGLITLERAEQDYGVTLTPDGDVERLPR